jgi:hypothetical protein
MSELVTREVMFIGSLVLVGILVMVVSAMNPEKLYKPNDSYYNGRSNSLNAFKSATFGGKKENDQLPYL